MQTRVLINCLFAGECATDKLLPLEANLLTAERVRPRPAAISTPGTLSKSYGEVADECAGLSQPGRFEDTLDAAGI